MKLRFSPLVTILFLALGLLVGCEQGNKLDPKLVAQSQKLLLQTEPADVITVGDARVRYGVDTTEEHDHADHDHAHDHADHDHHDHADETKQDEHPDHANDGHEHATEQPTAVIGEEIAVVGRIGGVDGPWDRERAAFWISDPAQDDAAHEHAHGDEHAHDHAHSHDHDDCPFCQQAQGKKLLAMVEVVDEQGKVFPVDARKLFNLKENQTVVVRGKARVDELGNLIVAANGIYVRND